MQLINQDNHWNWVKKTVSQQQEINVCKLRELKSSKLESNQELTLKYECIVYAVSPKPINLKSIKELK